MHVNNARARLQLDTHNPVSQVLADSAAQPFLLMLADDLDPGIHQVPIFIVTLYGPLFRT
jgi:hypothetical protein